MARDMAQALNSMNNGTIMTLITGMTGQIEAMDHIGTKGIAGEVEMVTGMDLMVISVIDVHISV